MAFTLAEIAARFGGRVVGEPQVLIRQVGTLERAGEGQIAFLANPRYRAQLAATRAAAVIIAADAETLTARPCIVCDNPYAYFARVSQLFNPDAVAVPGVQPGAHVAAGAHIDALARVEAGATVEPGAVIGAGCWIGAGSFVGQGVALGEGCRLHPSVVVYAGCRIGARAILHSGAVIGADGFGIARDGERWVKVPQIGGVRIGDDVEIGANTTVDRGAIEDTVIEDGVKLDNQIQIGHNCRVGAHSAIAGCAGLAGSVSVGRRCTIGAGAIVLGHLSICDDAHVSADTVISRSIRKPGTYTGLFPFDDHRSWARNTALLRHLAELADRVRRLEQQLSQKDPPHG
ncbi:MAG: UDP-3-O-(3-hydroxymyristoyl)glucosamine N-acyltransferase [Betaproteobacteria bacterium RIFCSPLOWO2_12_FULL_67_28]|nr:MAG: UDP-3-O-(3-hydroxymyristoyl)glucosamine N-acyltransferase [Betaproteobacteria bacterium RIFCSPLOWO2_02_FULL_68_150]OGA57597.1 MAG: UDP-3-O-(3-hydroxymyristoyl)glucosamine N-acyltransferase [Betaproteobacteria bacterium RIFCSPLOWO2_12_FULL_67_28]